SNDCSLNPIKKTLRTTGVIIAVVMFVSGILIALSKKLKCSKSK
uniref:FXYD domain-containing ion transport regulator n=1 Tax=Sinocyclocheilus rhinocerous TaxID=307959 RepID=A0A673GQZ0_9TELE